MPRQAPPLSVALTQLVLVRPEPPGQFTAQVVGLPDLCAMGATRQAAVDRVRTLLDERLASGELETIVVRTGNPWLTLSGQIDPNDPCEKVYLEELARARQEDLERTLREYEQEDRPCSSSSSTPTT